MNTMKMEYNFGLEKIAIKLAEQGAAVEFYTRDRDEEKFKKYGPTYHVFNGDKWLYCGKDRREADDAFAKAVQGVS